MDDALAVGSRERATDLPCERERVVDGQSAFVLQTSLDDYYVAYELNALTRVPERMAALYSELHQRIQD